MYEQMMGGTGCLGCGTGMGTQEVHTITVPPKLLLMARAFNPGAQQAAPPPDPTLQSDPSGRDDPNCAGCGPRPDDDGTIAPNGEREPFSLEPGDTGAPWWVWGGLAALVLGGAAGAGYWFWWRPRQAAQAAEEV